MFGGFNPFPNKRRPKALGVIKTNVVSPLENGSHPSLPPEVAAPLPRKIPSGPRPPRNAIPGVEAVWNSVLHGWSGYAKASRELLRRVAVYGPVRFADDAYFDPSDKEPSHLAMVKFHRQVQVSQKAPRITFLPPPLEENSPGYRIIYTMMETEKVHQDMIRIMNARYNECWTPTPWNEETFRKSGLKIPIYVMPLGVDPAVYHPKVVPFLPRATLMTGPNSGRQEVPKGFLFINVFQPSFRKGHDVLIEVFEETFGGDPDAGLILGTTAYSIEDRFPWKSMKSRIWTLPGGYSERQLASIYRACHVHVSTSRGEGWGLPTTECGAVGLPVIVPRVSSYQSIVPKDCGYFFDSDTTRVIPGSEKVSPWFAGIEFPDYGIKSRKQLSKLLRIVRENYTDAVKVGKRYREHVAEKMTWSHTAKRIADRLRQICNGKNV